MVKKFVLAGAITVGVSGVLLSAAPAQASESTHRLNQVARDMRAIEQGVAALEAFGGPAASPRAMAHSPVTSSSSRKQDSEPNTETEGHENEIPQRITCKNGQTEIKLDLKKSDNSKVNLYFPQRTKCKVKAQAVANSEGKVNSNRGR
jgi:hypothetical protein